MNKYKIENPPTNVPIINLFNELFLFKIILVDNKSKKSK